MAAGLFALPKLHSNGSPIGFEVTTQFDSVNIAQFILGVSGVMQLVAQLEGD
jgi:hypothetical protein